MISTPDRLLGIKRAPDLDLTLTSTTTRSSLLYNVFFESIRPAKERVIPIYLLYQMPYSDTLYCYLFPQSINTLQSIQKAYRTKPGWLTDTLDIDIYDTAIALYFSPECEIVTSEEIIKYILTTHKIHLYTTTDETNFSLYFNDVVVDWTYKVKSADVARRLYFVISNLSTQDYNNMIQQVLSVEAKLKKLVHKYKDELYNCTEFTSLMQYFRR